MAGRINALVDAGPYNPVPFTSSDNAAQFVATVAADLCDAANKQVPPAVLAQAPAPAVHISATVIEHIVPEPSLLDLIVQILKKLLPDNWPDFLGNLVLLLLLVAVYMLISRCLESFRRRHGPRFPISPDDLSDYGTFD
jgi:hypothetical protein